MLDRIIEEFVEEYTIQSPHATKEEVRSVLEDAKTIIENHKDATPEEIVNAIIDDCTRELNQILRDYSVPGMMSGLDVDNIHITLHGGKIRPEGGPLTENALFDVASITKLYTEVIAYKLINEGAFSLSDKIGELDPRFENMKDLTVEDVLKFIVSFRTDGRLEDVTVEEAKSKLFSMQVVQDGSEYNYNDMGLMVMKEVMESVTGKTYPELLEEYILIPYGLSDTYFVVPEDKTHLVTGTPNLDGSVNDLKANVMGGYSGHAGIRASNQDLLQFASQVVRDETLQDGLFEPNHLKSIRSNKMGNAYINPEFIVNPDGTIVSGRERSYFGGLAPRKSLAAQGSTRVILRASDYNGILISSTALSNIASVGDEELLGMIERENARRLAQDPNARLLDPEVLMKVRVYDGKTYKMHDPRALMNEDKTLGKFLNDYDNKIVLKLLLLNKLLKGYEHYYENVSVNRDITK